MSAYQPAPSDFQQQGQPNLGGNKAGVIAKYNGSIPDQDVHENRGDAAKEAGPPPLANMDPVQGYENVKYKPDAFIPPPPNRTPTTNQAQTSPVHADIPNISENKAREALLRECRNHCCYGKGAAESLTFDNITPTSAFHYQLETFTEGRNTAWAYEPYNGQPIDGPNNGLAPGPWQIVVQPGEMFKDKVQTVEVPHTASVKVCHNCTGAGLNRCDKCLGRGQLICAKCDGSGKVLQNNSDNTGRESVTCTQCNGSGRKKCGTCSGCGQVKCELCQMKGRLRCFINLTVTWKNNKADHVVERTSLPDHLIRGAEGKLAFQDTQPRVFPVTGFPDDAVNDASLQLVKSHASKFPTEKILTQRHWIKIVPVFEAHCTHKGSTFNFWVYGEDNLVHCPNYPQRVCWGCSIL